MWKKKICCLLVTSLLITSNVLSVYASSASTVLVSGGTVGTGGLASGYSTKNEILAITLVMTMMRSLGMTVHLSQQAIESGQTAFTVIQGKFREWAGGETDGSSALQPEVEENLRDKFEVINGGSSSDPEGKIYYTPAVVKLVQKFLDWLKSKNYINDSEVVDNEQTLINNTLYTATPMFVPDANVGTRYCTSSTRYQSSVGMTSLTPVRLAWCCVKMGNKYYVFGYAPTTALPAGGYNYLYVPGQTPLQSGSKVLHGSYRYVYWWALPTTTAGPYVIFTNKPSGILEIPYVSNGDEDINSYDMMSSINSYLDKINGAWNESTSGSHPDGIEIPGGDVDTTQLDNPDDKPVVVDPGVLPQLSPGSDAQVGIADYIEMLKQLLNKETDPAIVPEPLPAIDPATDTPIAVPVPDTLPVTPPWQVTLPGDQDAPQDIPVGNTPVTDPDEPAPPDVAIPEMSVKLEDYFPFCIPFDIYNLLSKFSAPPVTPEVHMSFDVPRMGISIPLDIDMSPFDGVANVARKMETVTYIVGLGMITRKTVLRG